MVVTADQCSRHLIGRGAGVLLQRQHHREAAHRPGAKAAATVKISVGSIEMNPRGHQREETLHMCKEDTAQACLVMIKRIKLFPRRKLSADEGYG